MTQYIALIRKDAGSDYGVDFPDFPGCITASATMDEARDLATEALRFHLQGMVEDKEPMPVPSTLEAVMADEHNRDALAFLVEVPTESPWPIRLDVTFPEELVRQIDARTRDRSSFLAEAARDRLKVIPGA